MSSSSHTDALVSLSRRQLWLALLFIAVLGLAGVKQLAFGSDTHSLMLLMPILVVMLVGASRRATLARADMAVVRDDELRQAAIARGWRNGFVALLLVQPVMAVLLTALPVAYPVALMACVTALVGGVVFLGTMLYCDRA